VLDHVLCIHRSGKNWKSMGCRIKTSCQVKFLSCFQGGTKSSLIFLPLRSLFSSSKWCHLSFIACYRLQSRGGRWFGVDIPQDHIWCACTGCSENARRWSNTRGVKNSGCFPICRQVSNFCLLQSSICYSAWTAVFSHHWTLTITVIYTSSPPLWQKLWCCGTC
jgi:hypothetical protein